MAQKAFLMAYKKETWYETYALAESEDEAIRKFSKYKPKKIDRVGTTDYKLSTIEEDPEGLPPGINARIV